MRTKEFFIFPFDVIPKGSNIILYAMGKVGRSYYDQLQKCQFCNVVACVDKHASPDVRTKYNILLPAEIKNFDYEYIVISVNSDALAGQIKGELVREYGVDPNKLIYVRDRRIIAQTVVYVWEDAFSNRDIFDEGLSNFWVNESRVGEFFSEWIREIIHYDDQEKEEVRNYISSFLCDSYKKNILIYRLLYECGLIDSTLFERYLNDIKKIDRTEDEVWALYDISIMELNYPSLRYPRFYCDKREIIKSCFGDISISGNDSTDRNSKRVAIICMELRGEGSSHNGLIVPYANELARQGMEVGIFPLDLHRYRLGESFIQPINPMEMHSEFYKSYHETAINKEIDIFYTQGNSMRERATYTLEKMLDFSPAVVLDFCGEYSYFSGKINQYFKIISIPMRGFCTSGVCDLYFCRNLELCIEENKIYQSVSRDQMVEALICSDPIPAQKEFRREDYGIGENAFVITTVGGRLDSEITEEFGAVLCDFLEKNSDSYWILVGGAYPQFFNYYERYKNLCESGRIIKWGYEFDLVGFYDGICDVYWNPDRMGAGGSMGSAMRCGLPVVTTRFPSDILPRLGLENAINGDYKECEIYVQHLHDDKDFYMVKSKLMKDRMSISSISKYIELLIDKVRLLSDKS